MRIGMPLEGLFVDMDAHFHFWVTRLGIDVESRFAPKMIRAEGFWASAKPVDGIDLIGDMIATLSEYDDFFILTERPKALYPVTRSWLKRNDIPVKAENIIMQSSGGIKRYDCRINEIDYFIDCDYEVLNTFRYDRTIPVGVGEREDFEPWIQVHDTLVNALGNLDVDLRREFIWQD